MRHGGTPAGNEVLRAASLYAGGVTGSRLLAELQALALRLGVDVRTEPLEIGLAETRGGLCRVRGRPLVLMDISLPLADRIDVMAAALSTFDLDVIHVSPVVRARIEACRVLHSGGHGP